MNNLASMSRKYGSQYDLSRKNNKVYQSILETIGNTPLVKLNTIPKCHNVACDIFVKCEFMNPAGSVKDRLGLAMVEDAKKVGVIKANTEFVEPTSGNTGIGVALAAATMGKKCTIVMGDKNSGEKVDTLRLLGAEVLKLKDGVAETVRQIKDNDPENVVMLNQIVSALDGVDMLVVGAGSGGTISGVGERLKQQYPDCIVVAADAYGSVMMNTHGTKHSYLVEGVGSHEEENLIVLDRSVIDHYEVVNDQEAFLMARELAKKEGLLCGGSSGLAVAAAIKAAKKFNIGSDKSVVVILPDGIRNYMTKFVSDQWMEAHFFMDPPERTIKWWKHPISNMTLCRKYPKLTTNITCAQALSFMKDTNIAVIVNDKEHFVGAISKDSLRNFATNPTKLPNIPTEEFNFDDLVSKHLVHDCYTLPVNGKKGTPTIGLLSRMLDITPFVVIGFEGQENDSTYLKYSGVVTGDDVLEYIYNQRFIY